MGESQVRLAHAQGFLSRPSLNPVQSWALQYWIYLERRTTLDDKERELEVQCFHLLPERWTQLYGSSGAPGDLGQAFGGEPELPVTDPSDLDAWFERLGEQRGMTGAQAEAFLGPSDLMLGHAEGTGRRV